MEFAPSEESSQIPLTLPSRPQQQQNTFSSNLSGTIDSVNDKSSNTQTGKNLYFINKSNKSIKCLVGSVPSNEESCITMLMVTSPSFNDEHFCEQNPNLLNESTDKVNLSSLSFLQTKQRRIDHRRNKSEPVINATIEDLNSHLESSSTSTTSNESAMSSNYSFENKRKSSTKSTSPSMYSKQTINGNSDKSSSTKKKKPWYNVSLTEYIYFFFQRLNESRMICNRDAYLSSYI